MAWQNSRRRGLCCAMPVTLILKPRDRQSMVPKFTLSRKTPSNIQFWWSVRWYVSLLWANVLKHWLKSTKFQEAAKGLDDYLPWNNIVNVCPVLYTVAAWIHTISTFQNTLQVNARGNSVNNVGRDQHYHFHFPCCPHARPKATHSRAETSICEFVWFVVLFHADSSLRTLALSPKFFHHLLKIEGRSSW